ncbi:MAG TPA: hypothetical protein VIU11_20125 [Nakamurella sp.]
MTEPGKALRSQLDDRPRKQGPSVLLSRGDSTHKIRSAWFQARESWPFRESPIDLLIDERARVQLAMPAAARSAQWSAAGPANIGGRTTSVVCHPANPERVWVGAAGGGIWSSPDAGKSWRSLWHAQPTLNIGALAIDPRNPDVIYAGTGEANLSADSHPGVGVFRSMDAGATWVLLAGSAGGRLPRRIGTLAVDPFDSTRLFAGGVSHAPGEPAGLYRSTDGGISWALVPLVHGNGYRCHDVQFRADRPGWLYATISALGSGNGIWRSADAGATWTHLAAGLPPADRIGRTALAIAPSDPDVIFAQVEGARKVLGIFRSADAGNTWTSVGGNHFANERQMSYNNTIVVHPERPDRVLCGGVDLHRTTDGGGSWTRVTRWDDDRGSSTYAHADHHALVMPAARPGLVYDVNDGGLDLSADGGDTWENRSVGLATNMFYDMTVAQTDLRMIAGGAQDNGTLATVDGRPDSYFELTGGDGGWVVIDPRNALHLFTTAQGMRMFRFRSPAGWREVSPPEDQFDMWMVFVAMNQQNTDTLFTGSRRVWRTTDDGQEWGPVSGQLDGSDITAIDIARADGRRIYVGTENGGIFRSRDGGETWSGNIASTVLPGRTVTRLESRPDDADVVYATVANFGSRHLFRSADGGSTWVDVDGGRLPDAPLHCVCVPAAHPTRVYVCGDAGVFVSDDEGGSWASLTGNLPNVMVVDLAFHETDRVLLAATYGRSIWRLAVD